jgi:hypothetical protein
MSTEVNHVSLRIPRRLERLRYSTSVKSIAGAEPQGRPGRITDSCQVGALLYLASRCDPIIQLQQSRGLPRALMDVESYSALLIAHVPVVKVSVHEKHMAQLLAPASSQMTGGFNKPELYRDIACLPCQLYLAGTQEKA